MVDLGHTPVLGGARWGAPGVVALRLSDLPSRVPAEALRRPQRGTRHMLMLVTVGYGRHMVDFSEYACRPGTLLWVRPGQAHQFGGQSTLDARLLLFAREMLPPHPGLDAMLDDAFGPTSWLPQGEDAEAVLNEITQIATDSARFEPGDPIGANLLRHQLAVLGTRLAGLAGHATVRGGAVMANFRRELEVSFATTRRVEDYASRLRCSVRTLTRACLVATGSSAKQVVDARVALEAKRLLACTSAPIADVGRTLGFPEPTNFGRFFVRETGMTPGEFRSGHAIAPVGQIAVG